MKLLHYLPNTLTCANLASGCLGTLYAAEGRLDYAAYAVWFACIFDFFDGFSARMLNVTSAIGKELDSLADVVSFGVLPSLVMFSLISSATTDSWAPYPALLIAVCSALRLAWFNLDESQKEGFIGLPTPANALFITSLIFLFAPLDRAIASPYILLLITGVFSMLMVSPLPLFALKFKTWSWRENRVKFTFVVVSVLLVGMLKAAALPLIILLYLLASLVQSLFVKP